MNKLLLFVVACLAATLFFNACKKEDSKNPVVSINPASQEAKPGQPVFINVTAADFQKLSRIRAVEKFRTFADRVLLDSTFNPTRSNIDYNFKYVAPDSANVGESIKIDFIVTDAESNDKTSTATVTIQ